MRAGNRIGIGSIPGVGTFGKVRQSTEPSVRYGRVYDVLLTDDAASAKKMKVPQGTIGAIQFRYVINGTVDESTPTQTALHYDPINRQFPVKNEVVEIFPGPSTNSQDGKGNNVQTLYYGRVVDAWSSAEHNALPDVSFKPQDGAVTGNLKESGKIVRLQHLPGDSITEGRFGNSVRIGSSNKAVTGSPWRGPDGSPLYIIRNGQNPNVKSGVKLTFEDINYDGSSLYFLSDQTVNFIPANLNFDSYGQDVISKDPGSTIQPNTTATVNNTQSYASEDLKSMPNKEQNAGTGSLMPVTQSVTATDELSFIPDKEAPEYFKSIEDDRPRHVDDGSQPWVDSLSDTPTPPESYMTINALDGLNLYFIAYMQHQQGEAGIKAILSSAKAGLSEVPRNNPYTKENVQYNMSKNVGADFGSNIKLTPANFIKYWRSKFDAKMKKAGVMRPASDIDSALRKYASLYNVPLDLVKTVCYVESSFNRKSGNSKYKGLFAIGEGEFQAVYPKDYDIFNIEKNTNVGVRLLKKRLASAGAVLKVIK